MRIVAVVQARMSSQRFPGKVLAKLSNQPLIIFLLRRLAQSKELDGVVVATSDGTDDDPLAEIVQAHDVPLYRGGLDDVLGRVTDAARLLNADAVVRVTGDCPLVDPRLLDEMVRVYRKHPVAYFSNISPRCLPYGYDLEIIRFDSLASAAEEAVSDFDREHVTPFIQDRPDRFEIDSYLYAGPDLSRYQWSVDRKEDLDLIEEILVRTAKSSPCLEDLIATLERNPELATRSLRRQSLEGGLASYKELIEREAPRPIVKTSDALWRRACRVTPVETQTLVNGPSDFVRGFGPKYLVRGLGSHVWDADGNEYIDYSTGLGLVTLGHAHPEVNEAVRRQLDQGNTLSLKHPLAVELAERICSMVPGAEMVCFGTNGSDARSAVVRLARAHTGRSHIARCGCNEWQEVIEASYPSRTKEVPLGGISRNQSFGYNDLLGLEDLLKSHEFAGIIIEPVSIKSPEEGFFEGVRELATRHRAVLIFDEVVTGFRLAPGGAQEYFGVTPDLACMGKGVANGHSLSLVAGKREFMSAFEEESIGFTFDGELSALAAAQATLDVMIREGYWGHVWRQGQKLQEGYRELARTFRVDATTDCEGLAPLTFVTFKGWGPWSPHQLHALFQQEMIRRGVLFSGSQFISLAHEDEDIDATLHAYRESFRVLRRALDENCVEGLTLGQVNEPASRES